MAQMLDYRIDMEPRSQWEIISVHDAAKRNLLYLQEVGLFYSGPAYYTTRKGLDSYLIKLTLSGSASLEYEGQIYSLGAGDFFWIDCQNPQHYNTAPHDDHWHVLWAHFYGANAAGYYSLFRNQNKNCPVGHLPSDSNVQQLLEKLLALYRSYKGELYTDIRSAGLLGQLLSGCVEAVSPALTEPAMPQVISAVCSYLQDQYDKQISLDDLSARFSVSKFHLQRTFRYHIGVSPAEYQRKFRMAKAKELLRTTTLPVSDIAYAVGIESTSYFISLFRKQEDITPLKYRNAWADRKTEQ